VTGIRTKKHEEGSMPRNCFDDRIRDSSEDELSGLTDERGSYTRESVLARMQPKS
jgi:hypothetical protein